MRRGITQFIKRKKYTRAWTDDFRSIIEDPAIGCAVGNVPYYEGGPLVAVLFGWPGATEQSMKQYSRLYDNMGVPSVMVVPTWREATDVQTADIKIQRIMAELQVELCNLRTDLVLHFFSSTTFQFLGPMVYLGRRVTKGIIFDSCPVLSRENDSWYNASRHSNVAKYLAEKGIIKSVGILSQFMSTWRFLRRNVELYWQNNAREKTALEMMYAPQLYLRSADDPFMRKQYVF